MRGGWGTVYLAEQLEPVRRKVAVKLLRSGMDSGSVLRRFEAERQALALMEHPGIAKILDAGRTDDGKPYFVMEHIGGTPITEFCDERRVGVRERLEMFAEVCRAIHHAHQKGVVHRDVKPSNVLVTGGRRRGRTRSRSSTSAWPRPMEARGLTGRARRLHAPRS